MGEGVGAASDDGLGRGWDTQVGGGQGNEHRAVVVGETEEERAAERAAADWAQEVEAVDEMLGGWLDWEHVMDMDML